MIIHARRLLTPAGWRENQLVTVTGGIIESPSRADSEDAGRTCGKGYLRI